MITNIYSIWVGPVWITCFWEGPALQHSTVCIRVEDSKKEFRTEVELRIVVRVTDEAAERMVNPSCVNYSGYGALIVGSKYIRLQEEIAKQILEKTDSQIVRCL